MHLVTFHYANITGDMGIPGVIKKMIADLRNLDRPGMTVLGSDLKNLLTFDWNEEKNEIVSAIVPRPGGITRSTSVVLPWGPYAKALIKTIRLRLRGEHLVMLPWGLFTHQQCTTNWNGGNTPLKRKRLVIHILKALYRPFVHHYLVLSKTEPEDSKLDASRCVVISMGKPFSTVLDRLDREETRPSDFSNEGFAFVGRGMWKEKGIGTIVEATRTQAENLTVRFFLSAPSPELKQRIDETTGNPALHWHFDVFGADLVPWIRRSSASITFNLNPVPLRTHYESLYAGTPVISGREQYLDGFLEVFSRIGLEDAVMIVEENGLADALRDYRPLDPAERILLAEVSRQIISDTHFTRWFAEWLENPQGRLISYFDGFPLSRES